MAGINHYIQRPSVLVKEVWSSGLYSRLPSFYRKNYEEWEKYKKIARTPHEVPPTEKVQSRWIKDAFGAPKLACNVPVRVHYPDQCDKGLWGGEGIVEGLVVKEKRWFDVYTPKIWRPSLTRRVFYSEILDKHLILTCTQRTLDLVDESSGLDFYILKTHPVDLRSQLALNLRREMLLALARKTMYPEDATKRAEICEKYAQFIVPEEEAEWFGLTLDEAVKKQAEIEQREMYSSIRPLKDLFREQLLLRLEEGTDISQRPPEKETAEGEEKEEPSTLQKLAFWKKQK